VREEGEDPWSVPISKVRVYWEQTVKYCRRDGQLGEDVQKKETVEDVAP
jgi:hypothetical protein